MESQRCFRFLLSYDQFSIYILWGRRVFLHLQRVRYLTPCRWKVKYCSVEIRGSVAIGFKGARISFSLWWLATMEDWAVAIAVIITVIQSRCLLKEGRHKETGNICWIVPVKLTCPKCLPNQAYYWGYWFRPSGLDRCTALMFHQVIDNWHPVSPYKQWVKDSKNLKLYLFTK